MSDTTHNSKNLNDKCGKLFFSLIETSNELIWSVDDHYNLICGNPAFHKHIKLYFNRSLKNGDSIFLQGFQENNTKWRKLYEKAFKRKEGFTIEMKSSGNFSQKYFEYIFNVVLESDGKVNSVNVFGRDVSKHKILKKQLKHSNEMLRKNEMLTLSGSWEWDIKEQMMYWSDQVFRIHDLEPSPFNPGSSEIINKSLSCYSPEDCRKIEDAFNKCISKGISYDLEARFETVKGRKIWIRTIGKPVTENGKVIKVGGNIQDITERKESEIALKNSEKRFRELLENIKNVSVQGYAADGTVQYWNHASEKLYGYSAEEALGKNLLDLIIPTEMQYSVKF